MSIRVDHDLESFIVDHFDSEESLLIVLVLRSDPKKSWSVAELISYLRKAFRGAISEEEAQLTERRFEHRLEDLEQKSMVRLSRAGDRTLCAYAAGSEDDERVANIEQVFLADRFAVNRIIYGVAARARILADAFRL
jgi:hypothetical protein